MINRSIAASALRKLDDETKLKFIDVFTNRSSYSYLLFATVLLFLVIDAGFPAVQVDIDRDIWFGPDLVNDYQIPH